jgi:hypothetical protein
MYTIQGSLYTDILCSKLLRNLWRDNAHLKCSSTIYLHFYLLALFVFVEKLVELGVVLVGLDVLFTLFEVLGVLLILGLLGLWRLLGGFSVDWDLLLFALVVAAGWFLAVRDGDLVALVSRWERIGLRNVSEVFTEDLI